MCAHGTSDQLPCPLCHPEPRFDGLQVAFLEDLLINHGCLPALANGRSSGQPERCHECACRIEDLVDRIRRLSSAMRRTDN